MSAWSCSTPVNDVAFFPDLPTDVSNPVTVSNQGTIPTSVGFTLYQKMHRDVVELLLEFSIAIVLESQLTLIW